MAFLKFKRSAVPAKVPTVVDLNLGELAINTYDGKVYIKKDNGTQSVVEISGGGGGGGTVTSVSGTGTVSGLTLSGTVTTTGNLTLGGTLSVTAANFASQTANTFLSAPNGAAGVPTFRAIVAADVPTLNQSTTGNAATATTLQTARSFTIGSTAKNFNGSANVSWTTTEIGAEFQQPLGVPRNNLGDPTVREAALFDAQFNNKTELYDINNLWFETSTDNVTWTTFAGVTDAMKRAFLTGDGGTNIAIPYGTAYFRIRMRATSYVYLNALYAYWSGQGHSTQVQMFKKHDSGPWTQHTSSTALVSSWPGHLYLPFNTIPFNPTATLGTHWHEIYALFIPTWNTSFPTNAISIYRGQFWGGYPAGKRNIYSTNEVGGVTFPNIVTANTDVRAPTFYDSGNTAFYVDPASTSVMNSANLSGSVRVGASGTNYGKLTVYEATDSVLSISNATSYATLQQNGPDLYINVNQSSAPDGATVFRRGGANTETMRINASGNVIAYVDMRSPIFYDNNNTLFYIDAAGTSNMNAISATNVTGTTVRATNTEHVAGDGNGMRFWISDDYKIYLSASANATWGGRVSGETTSDYNMYFRISNGTNRGFVFRNGTTNVAGIDGSGNGRFNAVTTAVDVRTPILYDSENTGFYVDPAGNSRLNGDLSFSSYSNIRFGATIFASGIPTIEGAQDEGLSFYGAGSTNGVTFGMYGLFSYASNQFRAPIFYDNNNTAFYLDPNSASNLSSLSVGGGAVFRSDWTTRFQSISDFVDGTLVTTDIPATATNGESFVIEITGKSYDGSNPPFKVIAQGYLYNDTIISYSGISYAGNFAPYIKVFQDGGFLKFWWPRISYWNSFNVNVMTMDAASNSTITRNRVTAIGNSTEPTGTKKQQINIKGFMRNDVSATNSVDLRAPIFYDSNDTAYFVNPAGTSNLNGLTVANTITGSISGSSASTTGNAATATTLQTARTINGVSFDGSANITIADGTKLPLAGGTLSGGLAGTTASFSGDVTASSKIVLGNRQPVYSCFFGGGVDTGWKKIADVTMGTALYSAAAFKIDLIDAESNFGSSANAKRLTFYASCRRSAATLDSYNDAVVYGQQNDYVRAVKTATGVYELQVRATANYRHITVVCENISSLNATINYASPTALPNGSTTGTIYLPTAGGSTDNFVNVNAAGTLASAGAITQAGNQVLHAGNYTSYAMPSGSSATNSVDVRAPIFYDSQDTNFYIDPAGNSRLNGDLNFSSFCNIRFGGTAYVTGVPIIEGAINEGLSFYGAGSTYGVTFGMYGTFSYASNQFRAPIFYDNNNTAFYVDANSTSNLLGLTVTNTITGSVTGSAGSLSSNANYMFNRGSVAQASVNDAILNGFYNQTNPSDSQGLLVFNAGGSLGPLQMTFTYGGLMQFRNKTDSTTWTAWKTVVTNVTGTAPIASSGGATPVISISAATTSDAGSMSAADKTKLNGIATGATANTGTVTSVGGTGTVSGLTLSGSVTTSGNLTLGGTLSLTSGNVTTALGYTPYNSTNPSGYIPSNTAGITGADAVTNIVSLTQAEYNAIGSPNASTLYIIVG